MKLALLAAAALVAVSPVPSEAATFLFAYTATNAAAPFAASGVIHTSDTLNALGGYDILSISGTVDGDVITGLFANPVQPSPVNTPDNLFTYDNVLYLPGLPYLDGPGVVFNSATYEYNLFSDTPTQYELYRAVAGSGYVASSIGTFTIAAAVPEPAGWTLLVAGFGLTGAALRRRLPLAA